MVKHGLFSFIYIVFTVVDAQETSLGYHLRSFAEEIPPPKERFFLPNVDFKYGDAVETDVEFKYFKSVLTKQPKILTIDTVKHVHMNKNVPTTYFIHGYTKDDSDPWYRPLRDELFMLRSHNVIYVNWPNAANKSYAVSAANIKPIGYYIAKFIVASQVPVDSVHLVGHSLGAHLAGFVGKWVISMTGDKVGRITGLDPAGPMFDYPTAPPTHRLDKSDAHFVDAVHTDIQGYGYTPPLGHVDFYPNGGKDQPGCPKEHVNVRCHHARATFLYVESFASLVEARTAEYIEEENFKVTIRPSETPEYITFGYYVKTYERGVYYLKTNSEQPFLII